MPDTIEHLRQMADFHRTWAKRLHAAADLHEKYLKETEDKIFDMQDAEHERRKMVGTLNKDDAR